MQYLVDLLHRHRVAIAPEVIQRQTGSNPYGNNTFGLTGKVAMVFNAIYFLPSYRQGEGLQQMEWDVAPIPKGARGRTTTNPTAGVTMWSGSKAPDAAWAFMRYLVSEEASRTYVDMALDGLPVHKGAADLVLEDSPPAPLQADLHRRLQVRPPGLHHPLRAARQERVQHRRPPPVPGRRAGATGRAGGHAQDPGPPWTRRSRPTRRSSRSRSESGGPAEGR